MKITGQTAIITGAGSGLGAVIANKLASAGATGLVIADVNYDSAVSQSKEITRQYDCQVLPLAIDVSDPSQVKDMADQTYSEFGRIDILVNNAGICPVVSWDETGIDDWNTILAINLTGPFLCTKAVTPYMQKNKYGRIVYISSLAGFTGSIVASVAYGVSKGGVIPLMKSMAKMYASDGILVNAVAPGTVNTPMAANLGEKNIQSLSDGSLLKRQAEPEEIAESVLFLVSDSSSYITGATLHVNGGALLI